MNGIHVMVDLETLDTAVTAAILSIGAVAFDMHGIKARFHVAVNIDDCIKAGLTVSGDTFLWWLGQSEAARASMVTQHRAGAESLESALLAFSEFYKGCGAQGLWGNGAAFDNAILANAYKAVGKPYPAKFYEDRCYRTLKNMNSHIPVRERKGVWHNALDDAENQARHLIDILQSRTMVANADNR